MGGWHEFYALEAKPLGRGGQAEVFKAKDRNTGEIVALKRVLSNDVDALARMRREIQVQMELSHHSVMPVIRHSELFDWYSMPLARRALKDVATPMIDDDIATVIRSICQGLEAANARQFVHRDITPANILDLGTDKPQWVLSDWGLVRRRGHTTAVRTERGEFGTAGFAAPETWVDAHAANHLADIYGLGRVVAWCATGRSPIPNVSLVPLGRWKRFVEATTADDAYHRCQTVKELLALLGGESMVTDGGAGADMPDAIRAIIRAESERSFPDDYSTRRFQIQRETEAWHRLQSLEYDDVPATVMATIISETEREFPRDFSTRVFQIDRQVVAFRALRDFRDTSMPSTVFDGIVASVRRQFPRDFSTQLFQLQRELEAWKDLER